MQTHSILVVDDEKNVRFTVAHALQNEGYSVDSASSGIEGLQRSSSNDYDLLLIDLRMPGMTGLEMLREVRRRSPELPAVIITAYGNPQQLVEAAELGAIDFVRKPFSIQTIRSVVRSVLELVSSENGSADRGGPEQLVRRGRRQMMLGNVEEARSLLSQAVEHDDDRQPDALILLGVCDMLSGDDAAAAAHLRQALEIDPSSRTASEYLTWLGTRR